MLRLGGIPASGPSLETPSCLLRPPRWSWKLAIEDSHTKMVLVKNEDGENEIFTSSKYYHYISRVCGPDNLIPAIEYAGKTGATGENAAVTAIRTHSLTHSQPSVPVKIN